MNTIWNTSSTVKRQWSLNIVLCSITFFLGIKLKNVFLKSEGLSITSKLNLSSILRLLTLLFYFNTQFKGIS